MTKLAVAVLEPGYAKYTIEQAVLEQQDVTIVAFPEQEDAVSSLKSINPVAVMRLFSLKPAIC